MLPNLEARLVVDEEGGVDAEEGHPGELWLRGPTVMKVCSLSVRICEGCFEPELRVISIAQMLLKKPLLPTSGSRLVMLLFGTKKVTFISLIAVKNWSSTKCLSPAHMITDAFWPFSFTRDFKVCYLPIFHDRITDPSRSTSGRTWKCTPYPSRYCWCRCYWDTEWEGSDRVTSSIYRPCETGRDQKWGPEDRIFTECEELDAGKGCKLQIPQRRCVFF